MFVLLGARGERVAACVCVCAERLKSRVCVEGNNFNVCLCLCIYCKCLSDSMKLIRIITSSFYM